MFSYVSSIYPRLQWLDSYLNIEILKHADNAFTKGFILVMISKMKTIREVLKSQEN